MDIACARASYLTWLRNVRRCSAETVRCYGSTLNQLVLWAPPGGLQNLTVGDLEAFVTRTRRNGRAAAAATQKRDADALKSFYKWAIREGIVEKDVAEPLLAPKVRNVAPKPIDDDTWLALWSYPTLSDQDRAWLGLGFFCGLRRAELVSVRQHHLSVPARKLVSFVRKGGGDHTVPIGTMLEVFDAKLPHLQPGRLWPVLERLDGLQNPDDRIVGVTDGGLLGKRLDRWLTYLSLPRYTPHSLRHSAVTNLLRAGIPLHLVSRLMNHTDTSTTMRYVKAGGDELSEWLRRT